MHTEGSRHRRLLQRQPQQDTLCDWDAVLQQTLASHATTPAMPRHLPRTMHRVSRSMQAAARATICHLSLSRYQRGRLAAQRLLEEAGESVTPAIASAAAAPPIPWGLLAATPSLTSLDMRADQLQDLMKGGAVLAAAAAQASGGPSVLADTLGRLRCLRVVFYQEAAHEIAHLGRLLGASTQLTQLVLSKQHCRGWAHVDCSSLLEALEAAQPPAAAGAAAAAAAGGGATAATATAGGEGGGSAAGWVPPLRHLEVERGSFPGLVPGWLSNTSAAAQLTSLHLNGDMDVSEQLQGLEACPRLQEVVVLDLGGRGDLHLPQDLTRLTALTRLELKGELGKMPAVVWDLAPLRRLAFSDQQAIIPSGISRLKQLRLLDVSMTFMEELPADLAICLPHLEELDVTDTQVAAVPEGLTRLTRLHATRTPISNVSALAHLVRLKELEMLESVLRPPMQPLTKLSALEDLTLGWINMPWPGVMLPRQVVAQLCVPAPLPALRSLVLFDWAPQRVDQLAAVVASQQLTHLELSVELTPAVAAAVSQLGVLPQLQVLSLGGYPDPPVTRGGRVQPAAPWLQQQTALTRLILDFGTAANPHRCEVEGSELLQLPEQLEELDMINSFLVGHQPPALTQLSRLRKLALSCLDHQQLPPWLSSCSSLEELSFTSRGEVSGWEVLAALPALRHVWGCDQAARGGGNIMMAKHVLPHAPHLAWSPRH